MSKVRKFNLDSFKNRMIIEKHLLRHESEEECRGDVWADDGARKAKRASMLLRKRRSYSEHLLDAIEEVIENALSPSKRAVGADRYE